MTKISTVCFDLGKVLLHFDWQIMLGQIAQKSPFPPEEISRLMKADASILAYEKGGISSDEFFAHFKKLIEYSGTPEELRHSFSDIFTPLTANIEVARLLSLHYPLAIISNTNEAHITFVEKSYDFFPLFRARIYSYEVKTMKPRREIYEAALAALGGIDPREALFIDDLEPNIRGAQELGWQTIHVLPDTDLRGAVAPYRLRGLE